MLSGLVAVLTTNLRNLVNAPYYIASLELHWRWTPVFQDSRFGDLFSHRKTSSFTAFCQDHRSRFSATDGYTQKELVELTGMGQGFVSRTLRTLEQENLVRRTGRTFRATNPMHLLNSWQEVYDFTKHRILKGHIATRSSEELTFSLSHAIQNTGLSCAATGLAGAWLRTRFASFRLVTLYLNDEPSSETLAKQGFRKVEKGANVWLVIPNDEGVLFGTQECNGIQCAHPVQVYLDLQSHPERSKEAAEHLKEKCLAEIIHASE